MGAGGAGGGTVGWNTGGGAADGVWEAVREPHPHAAPKQTIKQSLAMIELIALIVIFANLVTDIPLCNQFAQHNRKYEGLGMAVPDIKA